MPLIIMTTVLVLLLFVVIPYFIPTKYQSLSYSLSYLLNISALYFFFVFPKRTQKTDIKRLELEHIDHIKCQNEFFKVGDDLNDNEDHYEKLFENIPEAVIIQDLSSEGYPSTINKCNIELCKILDVPDDNLSLAQFQEMLKPINSGPNTNFFLHDFNKLSTGHFIMQLEHGNTNPKTLQLKCRILKFGTLTQLVSTVVDVTTEFRKKEELVNNLAVLFNLINNIKCNVLIINKNYQIEFWSQNLEVIPEINAGDIMSKQHASFTNELTGFDWTPHINKALTGQVNYSGDFQLEKSTNKWFKISFAPFYKEDEISGVISIMSDITEPKQREQDLVNQKIINEEVAEIKKIILSNISHEVRTPLNNINGFLNLFSLDNLSQKQKKYLNLIKTSSDQLLETVTNIVNISLLESNQLKFYYSWFYLFDVIQELKNWLTTLHYNRSRVQVYLHDEDASLKSLKIFCERDRLKQLLEIFIKNAIKFTPKGSVNVVVQITNERFINISVSDTGIGMERTYADLVFQPFLTAHGGTSKIYDGIGLGLSIAKNIVDKLKGFIEVETEVGSGTTFSIRIPTSNSNNPPLLLNKLEKDLTINYKNALLIEDSYESSEIFNVFFSQQDLKVTSAANGASGIETFFARHDFDIVFCDLRLPDIDGFEVLKALRRINTRIPIIAQSAFVFRDLQKKCLEAGFNDFIAKPIDLKKITKVLTQSY